MYEVATGGDLTACRLRQPKKRFTEVTAKRYVCMIAKACNEMHKKNIVHRDIKPDNIMLSDDTDTNIAKMVDFGTARIVDQNKEFKPEKNETINQTVAGSGFYMSPEMRSEKPNGLKTDVWSFAITIGVLFGLDNICPSDYKGGIPGFIKDSSAGKNDMVLHHNGINLSPIVKDLLKNMLLVDVNKRFGMQQILDHRYITMTDEDYSKGFNEWYEPEIVRLTELIRKEEDALSKVSDEHKKAFLKMNDASKEHYLTQADEDAKTKFIGLPTKLQEFYLSIEEDQRAKFYELLENNKRFASQPVEGKIVMMSLPKGRQDTFLNFPKDIYDETVKLSSEHLSAFSSFNNQDLMIKFVKAHIN